MKHSIRRSPAKNTLLRLATGLGLSLSLLPLAQAQESTLGESAAASAGPNIGPLEEAKPALKAVLKALEAADVSKEQRVQIRGVLQKYYPTINPLVDKLIAERGKQRDVVRSVPVDEAAIRKQSAAVAVVEADLAVQFAYVSAEIQSILRPEQIQELRSIEDTLAPLFEQKRQRIGRWLMSSES